MLVLHSTSRCDVCLLEYTWENSAKVPHAIACGHIFCRDCLYATTPPICPLCRRQYQPGKIKRLHVDRPENVDEAREDEMRRQQLDLLEKLVEVWDIELKAQESPVSRPIRQSLDNRPEPGSRTGSDDAMRPTHGGIQVEEDSEDDVVDLRATSRERRVRILASAQMVDGASDDEEHQDQSEDDEFHEFPAEVLHENDTPGVEEILDGIAGEQGVGRRFLDRWGSGFGEAGPVVSVREVQRRYMGETLRQVDVWLEGQDLDTCTALRKNRLFFTQHLAVRMALNEALEAAKLLTEDRKKLVEDKEEMERIKTEERKTAREELERYVRYVEQLTKQNQDLKSRLSIQQQETKVLSERPPLRSNVSTPATRNPLPPPPQPVSTQHLPSFLQAVSETSGSVSGSTYANSHYTPSHYTPSHYTPSMAGSSSMGVRFAPLAPGSPPRARERYGGLENGESPHGSPRGRSSKKKSKSKDPPSAYSYTYRDTPAYFDENNHHRQTSSTSTVNPSYPNSPMYPNSAPASQGGFTTIPPPASYGSGPSIHSARPSTSVLPSNSGPALPYHHTSSQPTSPYSSQSLNNGAHTPNRPYATRSAGLQTRFEDTSQPLDAFSLTSAYLREFSSGFVNGQEAALGVGRFAPPPVPQPTTSARSSRLNHRREDTSDSLIFTNESAEDGGLLEEEEEGSSGSRSSSRSHTGSHPVSSINHPTLGSILDSHGPPRAQMGSVPLPPSSHGHPSPAISYSSAPRSLLNRQSGDGAGNINALGLNTSRSGPPSSASSAISAPPSLPEDPAAAAAAINQNLNLGRYAREGRRSPTRSHDSWGTVNSNAQSNSLISDLIGLRVGDNVSVRTRGTRETRFSVTSFGSFASGPDGNSGLGSVDESGERSGPRDSRRNSRGSELATGHSSPYIGGDSSPARPIGSMVGVLPLEEQDSDSSPYQQRTGSSTTTLLATSNRSAPYFDDTLRSATAMDRRMPSNSTVTPRSAGHSASNHTQTQSLSSRPSQSNLQPTEAQRIAASVGWNSSSSSLNLGMALASGYYTEVERSPAISRRRNRHREDTSHRDERADRRNHELPALPAPRSQTSMGVAPSNGSASGWMWDSDSNSYPSPFSTSQNNDRGFSQLPSTASHSRNILPSTSTHSGPYSSRPHREREQERSSRHRNDYSTSQTHAPTRPSLLSSESTSPFPVTVESTDDERYSRETRGSSHVHASTQNGGGGRNTRTASYPTSASATLSSGSRAEESSNNPPLQSFGNALGLDLLTTTGGISAPTPITTSSTQRFLRSFSYDE
ncbi:hypothetical protein CPB83DRAFT_856498 [Crepidotus variabilis]|uniref:RING-type domain-containing protein n=1 Tax=Crepidotus variabilis TaxID=179855 RepID=A0A9P6JNI3_9AGAR|nr:hypothetical protein CPB83DRAFT_856498 [Crepidotus variabilis]